MRNHFLFVLYALALSIANIDNEITLDEFNTVEEIFQEMIGNKDFPEEYLKLINIYLDTPPAFDEILEYLHLLDNHHYEEIKDMLIKIMDADGVRDKNEIRYIQDFEAKVTNLMYYKLEYETNFTNSIIESNFKENINACLGKCVQGAFRVGDVVCLMSDSKIFYTKISKLTGINKNEYLQMTEGENRIVWFEKVPKINIKEFQRITR